MKQKKSLPLFLIIATQLCNTPALTQGLQPTPSADDVLKEVIKVIDKNKSFSYIFTRETKYHADNYYDKRTVSFYMEKNDSSIIGLRFQTSEAKQKSVFNGKENYRLDLAKMTIDSATYTYNSLQSSSFLYHSYAMLSNCLPIVLSDTGFTKTLSDTIIEGRSNWKVAFEKADSYFSSFIGLEKIDKKYNLRRPYELYVDKNSSLPILFITKYVRGSDDRDFVKMYYQNVKVNPPRPTQKSWEYSSYSKRFKPYIPEPIKEEVKTGTLFNGFLLNEYKPLENGMVPFSKFKGKIILLEFWFKACGPCMEAMPKYKDLQNSFSTDSFQLITINVEDKKEDIAFFYKKHQPNYPMLYNGAKMFKDLGFNGCPTALLLNKEGVIVQKYSGFNLEKLKKDITTAQQN